MIVEPIKATITTMATISAGGATVLTEGTLIPIGIFMSGVVVLTTAAWKISAAIQRQADAMSMMDLRINVIERRCRSCNHKELK
jgi:hypothetical protein